MRRGKNLNGGIEGRRRERQLKITSEIKGGEQGGGWGVKEDKEKGGEINGRKNRRKR